MQPNPVLRKLGLKDNDRAVIIHCDDIGMCQASVQAFAELWEFGLVSSAATMAPCSWFPAAARFCREHPGVDMGVHITLNSEWEDYRWRPLSTCDPASGMLDADGYLHQWQPAVWENADPQAVKVEINAQVQAALRAGIDVTHIDTHMGTVQHPKFQQIYLQAALDFELPAMLPRQDAAGFRLLGLDDSAAEMAAAQVVALEAQGVPLLDHVTGLGLNKDTDPMERARQVFRELPAGITHFIIHPSTDTPELRAITHSWADRVQEYELFKSDALRRFIVQEGIQIIGYRALRSLLRKEA